ncbi:MAG: type II secretion system protein [Pseudomonadota bacterium]
MGRQQGLTLVELLVVATVFLGLAAVAMPRYVLLNETARMDSVRALADEMRATAEQSHAIWFSAGQPEELSKGRVPMKIVNGYPAVGAMRSLLVGDAMFGFDGLRYVYREDDAYIEDCYVSYAPPSFSLGRPEIKVNVEGC